MSDSPTRSAENLTRSAADACATATAADGHPVTASGSPPPSSDRYVLGEEIARGGMGVVYRARDSVLGREVAVKVLQDGAGPHSTLGRRFADEARIAAQLQHPAIPPVHDLGTLPDGRPFLAMKLIKGETLEELLKARADAAGDRGRFVAAFEQVCQAVAFAHDRKVIHRDLKPSNVMVGSFGEVQVMDWGLAKVLAGRDRDRPEEGPEQTSAGTVIHSQRDSDHAHTQAGSVMGTPSFMAPEQAQGAVGEIDERADVFGLGAVLCAILTGRPPYAGPSTESVRLMAIRGETGDAFARLDASGAEPELVALAKRCLAVRREDRPRDAGEVAEAVAGLRADAERRARQAEMDRAKAEVQAAEERKRRKVKRALAAAVVGLVAVAAAAGWWIDHERAKRAAEREADQFREVAAANARAAELREQRLAYERDVKDAINEVHIRLREGREDDENLDRWLTTLVSASFPLRRAQNLLDSGEPSDELRAVVIAVEDEWARDNRDRLLLVELDRVADANEIRFFFPYPLTAVTSDQFAEAFRRHGIDLLAVPTGEAVAWLKKHRLRDRLVVAVRNWHQSLPTVGAAAVIDPRMLEALESSAAVAGSIGPVALAQEPNQVLEKFLRQHGEYARLRDILQGVTEDSFTQRWWGAVEQRDVATLQQLVARSELRRMPSRAMASLADGFARFTGSDAAFVDQFLAVALERFPGEYWVHFRLALRKQFESYEPDSPQAHAAYRHLTAALAIRPTSCIARLALGVELLEHHNDEAAGLRMLESAIAADPTSPWPHLFLGMHAVEQSDWPRAMRAFKECIRVDPDTGFFMTSATANFFITGSKSKNTPTERELVAFFNELIALHPKHPGGYDLLASYYLQKGDHRAALPVFRKVKEFERPESMSNRLVNEQLRALEAQAAWEQKLPAVLRGEIQPANSKELLELATYCAAFEKKFALATRFVREAFEADPLLLEDWYQVAKCAGWAVQAGAGQGADASTTPLLVREQYRRQAVQWLRETIRRQTAASGLGLGFYASSLPDLAPVRDQDALAQLPAAERVEWEKLWTEVTPVIKKRKSGAKSKTTPREVAPPPREKM